MEITGKILTELRKENGYSQKYIADYLGIDSSNYSKYERGELEINLKMLRDLSKLYGVSADYILGLKEY